MVQTIPKHDRQSGSGNFRTTRRHVRLGICQRIESRQRNTRAKCESVHLADDCPGSRVSTRHHQNRHSTGVRRQQQRTSMVSLFAQPQRDAANATVNRAAANQHRLQKPRGPRLRLNRLFAESFDDQEQIKSPTCCYSRIQPNDL